jgi:hypothetical protein
LDRRFLAHPDVKQALVERRRLKAELASLDRLAPRQAQKTHVPFHARQGNLGPAGSDTIIPDGGECGALVSEDESIDQRRQKLERALLGNAHFLGTLWDRCRVGHESFDDFLAGVGARTADDLI